VLSVISNFKVTNVVYDNNHSKKMRFVLKLHFKMNVNSSWEKIVKIQVSVLKENHFSVLVVETQVIGGKI
jgi:hypothetical protein